MKRVVWAGACASLVVIALVIACGGSSSPPIADAGSSGGGSTSSSSSSSTSGSGTGTGTSGGTSGVTPTPTDSGVTDFNKCEQASDCEWGEIDKEILTKKDCMCLFGCPHLPLNKTTVRRREDQFKNLCDGRIDGNGKPCPIDDCARPGAIECRNGVCAAPSRDGGNGNQM